MFLSVSLYRHVLIAFVPGHHDWTGFSYQPKRSNVVISVWIPHPTPGMMFWQNIWRINIAMNSKFNVICLQFEYMPTPWQCSVLLCLPLMRMWTNGHEKIASGWLIFIQMTFFAESLIAFLCANHCSSVPRYVIRKFMGEDNHFSLLAEHWACLHYQYQQANVRSLWLKHMPTNKYLIYGYFPKILIRAT